MCIDVAVLTVLRAAVIYKYISELSVLGHLSHIKI